MFASLLLIVLAAKPELPTLTQVETLARGYTGVEIEAEMQSPSVIPIQFRISPQGYFWAKYPTSEMFITAQETITWMPDRKEFSKSKGEDINPLPIGFHTMWPGPGDRFEQIGSTIEAPFGGRVCAKMVCKSGLPYLVDLFVDQATLIPTGTRVSYNGTVYETVYKKVKIGALDPKLFVFRPPTGAKPSGTRSPNLMLIKPGSKLEPFRGSDLNGTNLSSTKLLKANPKGLVLNFWFSSCVGCVEEMPFLAKLGPKLSNQGIGLIGVNPIDDAKSAKGTSLRNKLGYPTLIGSGAISLRKQVSVEAYPVTVVIDARASVIDAFMGFDENRLRQAVAKIGGKF